MLQALLAGGGSIVGNLLGGWLGGNAAKKAAEQQARSAQEGINVANEREQQANRGISDSVINAQKLATIGKNRVLDTAGAEAGRVTDAATQANERLNPYADVGETAATTLRAGFGSDGAFAKPYTAADLQIDPGYDFRLAEGEKTLNRSAAARGGAISGETLKALAGYSQGLASQEFQNAFQRYQTDTQSRYDRLFGTSKLGMDAADRQGQNTIGGAKTAADLRVGAANTALGADEYTGTIGVQGATTMGNNTMENARITSDLLTQKGNAEASGTVGKASAWSKGIGSAASNAMDLARMLKNPATGGK